MARICTQCGSELLEGDVYCGKCGSLSQGMTAPENAWSRVSADLDSAPKKKKRGCLTALLIFIVILALLAGALYFFTRRLGIGRDGFDFDFDLSAGYASSDRY